MRVDGSNQSTTALGAPTTQSTRTDLDPQSFMRLLITQIRHQDPLQPMDTQAMMTQLTQLTEVERLTAIDGRLQSLQIATGAVANTQAADLVGRTVEADTSHLDLGDLGPARGNFQLGGAAAHVTVTIRGANGQTVRTLELGPHAAGPFPFEWDGFDTNGTRAPSDRYSIQVAATDADGRPVTTETRVRGPVQSVRYDGGYPALEIGGTDVMMGDVRSVSATAPTPTTTTTTTP